ncbi:caspase family protein [Methylohalobius crimeensis]|uniref:caspase family protein n=1 Tax=Methylohalobius crimeensis TaxID=244365 RepID=UPI0003B5C5E0|nr:caspase family protein [Methylohalobius crimeensis]
MGVSLANLNRWPVLFALYLGGFLSVSSATALERRTALVLGNGDYRIAPLDNPVNDARDMAATLERLGFEVDLRLNLDRKGIRAAMREFGEKLAQGGVGLFYYAGHGVQIAGRNYLVPLGTEIHAADEVIDEAVDAGLVMRKMESAGNPVNIVILDACRDNPFVRSYRSLERGLAKMEGPLGSLIAYATAPGDTALDGEGRNGVYTQHLLEAMTRPGLTLEQVFKRVRNGVRRQTDGRQIPWEESSLTGDFYFIPPDGKTSPDSPPPSPTGLVPAVSGRLDALPPSHEPSSGRSSNNSSAAKCPLDGSGLLLVEGHASGGEQDRRKAFVNPPQLTSTLRAVFAELGLSLADPGPERGAKILRHLQNRREQLMRVAREEEIGYLVLIRLAARQMPIEIIATRMQKIDISATLEMVDMGSKRGSLAIRHQGFILPGLSFQQVMHETFPRKLRPVAQELIGAASTACVDQR